MKAAESRRAHALAVEVATLKQQMAVLQTDKSSCSDSFRTVSRTTSDAASHQVEHRSHPCFLFCSLTWGDNISSLAGIRLRFLLYQSSGVRSAHAWPGAIGSTVHICQAVLPHMLLLRQRGASHRRSS